jgi:hypothetical protein
MATARGLYKSLDHFGARAVLSRDGAQRSSDLIRSNGCPIMFFAALEDIVKESNKYTVYFHNWSDLFLGADIHFVLDCTPKQINQIMVHRSGHFKNYALVAHINDVRKI